MIKKNVEIKIVEEVIIKDNFDDTRIELDVRSIEVVNRSFEEYDSISTITITDLTDTITNLSKNYSELILKSERLIKEKDSIEILLDKERGKIDELNKTKSGQRILKRIQ